MHRALPEPARPVAVFGVHRAVPIRDKPPRAQRDDVHKAVLSVILGDQFSQNLAAAVPCIRPINAGGGDQYDLTDAGGSGGFENLEGAAHIEVKEIVSVFLAAIFVDAVPGGDMDDGVAAAKYLRQFSAVQNGRLDEHRSLVQRPWGANIENDRRIAFFEQPRYEGLPEISRSSGQQHLHGLFRSPRAKLAQVLKSLKFWGLSGNESLRRRRRHRSAALTAGSRRIVVC